MLTFSSRNLLGAGIALALLITPAAGQAVQETRPAGAATKPPTSYQRFFRTHVLAGGSINELEVQVEPTLVPHLPAVATIEWQPPEDVWTPRLCTAQPPSAKISVLSKSLIEGDSTRTLFNVFVPSPPCWWPLTQLAKITIKGNVAGVEGLQTFFDAAVHVSVFWFPFLATLLAVALIYPGCAITVWYLRQRQYKRKQMPRPPDSFLATLDPVQITANPHGRASLAKLQIFLFTLIVFGILLFFQLRCGILAGLSADIMALLGISAVGAVGGKMTYRTKRRLSLDNWAWLRRKEWLPERSDIAERAKWSELFLDSDTKEFDPYGFQMAVFSLVVAVALIRTNLGGLGTFKIPNELLALLGISQAVFIGGKAVETSAYNELDAKLDEVRRNEAKYKGLKAKAAISPDELQAARVALDASVIQAAEIFAAVYREQLSEDKRLDVEQLAIRAKKDVS